MTSGSRWSVRSRVAARTTTWTHEEPAAGGPAEQQTVLVAAPVAVAGLGVREPRSFFYRLDGTDPGADRLDGVRAPAAVNPANITGVAVSTVRGPDRIYASFVDRAPRVNQPEEGARPENGAARVGCVFRA